MKRMLIGGLLALGFGACLWFSVSRQSSEAAQAAQPMLSHDVYFSLKDNSAAAKQKLIAACKKYLSKHPGTVFFAAGTLVDELKRPVNDLEFDVALHIVFKDK